MLAIIAAILLVVAIWVPSIGPFVLINVALAIFCLHFVVTVPLPVVTRRRD